MSLVMDLMIRSSAILLVGLVFEAVLAHRSAALRHCVLAATVFAAAAVVPLSLAVPAWEISWSAPGTVADVPVRDVSAVTEDSPPVSRPSARRQPASSLSLMAAVWAGGFIPGAAVLFAGIVRLIRVGVRATRVRDGRWAPIVTTVTAAYGLRREVVVLQTDAPDLLATWGVFRPRVLLPSHAHEWSDDRIHAVLCHELAHIRRNDWLVQMSAECLRAVCWFNPLMWTACTRLRRSSEQACDDAVLERGVPAREYAGHLLELARRCRRPGFRLGLGRADGSSVNA